MNRTIFISYNHKDQACALKIRDKLIEKGWEVMIDVERMQTGENIDQFIINCIQKSDVTLSLISANSLLSAWVTVETMATTLDEKLRNRKFIPCYIDNEFFNRRFIDDKALIIIKENLQEIGDIIEKRIKENIGIEDLENERSRYLQLQNNLPSIIGRFRSMLCINLAGDQFDTGMQKVLTDLAQITKSEKLPNELLQNLITDQNQWVFSIKQDLLKQNVPVGNKPASIFQHYGWLIEAFLQKLETPGGKAQTLRRFSFMAEAYQSTLRYLCYIQFSQIFQVGNTISNPAIAEFIKTDTSQQYNFDYLNLLLITTNELGDKNSFMPEIKEIVEEFIDINTDLHETLLLLNHTRKKLVDHQIAEDDGLPGLLEEYLTALVYWLRRISFLARYRLVSIKEINLSYRMGGTKRFLHLYGELHGMYSEAFTETASDEDYNARAIEDVFTYNQSVLLFKGRNVEASFDNIKDPSSYLSLSPLIIDQSVFSEKPTQTPEIYYYIGKGMSPGQYGFAQYKNELPLRGNEKITSNKELYIKVQNIHRPKLDELFEQLEKAFQTIKKLHS
jgi:hypothetical protein